jgi:hypothetical protein
MDFLEFWKDPVGVIYNWLMLTFTGWGMPGMWANVLVSLIGIIVLVMFAMVLDIMLVWVERKVVARFQGRIGPNRVGPFGLLQPFPDIIKLILKEDITPDGADKVVFNMAPVISAMSVIILWAVFPLAARIYGTDLNVAVLYLVAAGAFGTLAVIMAGWSSNNKYALLGAFRGVATMISFEIPLVVALMIPVVLTGSMSLKTIIEAQVNGVPFIRCPAGLHYLPDQRHRRTGPRALRFERRRIGNCLGFPYRIQRDEVRLVLCGRTAPFLHGGRFDGDFVLRRLGLVRSRELYPLAGQPVFWRHCGSGQGPDRLLDHHVG